MPGIHYARLSRSPRQQRVLRLLSDGREHTTRELIHEADVCALSAIITELRRNGIPIASRCQKRVWFYRLGK